MAGPIPSVRSNEGVTVPAMIYGTAWKREHTAELVELALQAGFRGIDTACQPKHYHEAGVGEGLSRWLGNGVGRESVYLQSKFTPLDGQDPARLPYDASLPLAQQITQSFRVSLQNLRTDYLDSLLLHSPLQPFTRMIDGWEAMESLYLSGGVRQLGISNCYNLALLQALYDVARIKPAVVQNRFYAETGFDQPLRAWCRERGIIYQSFWTLTANRHLLGTLSVGRLAEKYHCEPAQILLRYVTQQDIVPLTGTSSPEHMHDDLKIFDFRLNREELETVECALLAGS